MNMRTGHRLLVGTAFLILVGGVTYSCKDFLDVAPQGALDEGTLSNQAGVEGTLIAAYRALDWNNGVGGAWGSAASNWVWGSVTSDDAHKGSDANDQAPIADIELYNWGTGLAEGYLNDKWRAVWEGVVRSNATLRLLSKVSGISASDAASIKGEALFLRAHFHFEAWRMWGNIPYYFETDADFNKPNNLGVDSVAKLIISDLDAAIGLLPATPRNGQVGRVTKWAATAYKGRVQAYIGDYAGALTTLRSVQASGVYALETSFDHVWTGFHQFANGKETILAYEASINDGEPNGNNSNYGERLNFPYVDPFCCGFHQPSQNLVNFFVVNDSGLPLAVTNPAWNTRDTSFAANTTVPVDPRLDWTAGRDRVPYKDWGLHTPKFIRDRSYSGPYSPKKNVHEKRSGAQSAVGWNSFQLNSVHIHIYRYADVLLLLAEAAVETNNLEEARGIVNQIRARAGQTAEGCGSGSTDSLTKVTYPGSWPAGCVGDDRIAVPLVQGGSRDTLITPYAYYKIGQYTTPWTDQAFARRAVRYERRLELAMEGQRFFDLRRTASADSVITNYLAVEKNRLPWLGTAAPFTSRHHLYPIPQIQIELSQGKLTQNPEW
ncbi:MAG TPA: RagB/SusD family nutrient uptake outer membrane protein [Gemmatimonadales bacterium]